MPLLFFFSDIGLCLWNSRFNEIQRYEAQKWNIILCRASSIGMHDCKIPMKPRQGREHSRRKKPHTEKFRILYMLSEDSLTESSIIAYNTKTIQRYFQDSDLRLNKNSIFGKAKTGSWENLPQHIFIRTYFIANKYKIVVLIPWCLILKIKLFFHHF